MQLFFRSQLLTLIFSWVLALFFIILGGTLFSPFFVLFLVCYNWVPALVAFYNYHLEKMRFPMDFKWNKSYLFASIVPLLLGLVNYLIALPFSEIRNLDYLRSYFPASLSALTPLSLVLLCIVSVIAVVLIGGVTLFIIPALGQEIMWRGYVWDKLKFLGFWKASILMGLFWGLWKAPLVLLGYGYPEHPFLGTLWMIFYTVSISPLLLYFRLKTHSVLGASIFHGIYLAFFEISLFLFKSPNQLWLGLGGLCGIVACAIFNLILYLHVRKTPFLEYEI